MASHTYQITDNFSHGTVQNYYHWYLIPPPSLLAANPIHYPPYHQNGPLTMCFSPLTGTVPSGLRAKTHAILSDNPNHSFAFSWTPTTPSGAPVTAMQITVQTGNIFACDAAKWADFRNDFNLFRQTLAKLEAADCLARGANDVVAQRIAANMPMPFEQMLWFYYGYDPQMRVIDLAPGMQLHMQFGGQYFVSPPATGVQHFLGGAGGATCEVVSELDTGKLHFSPLTRGFANPIQAHASTSSTVATQAIANQLDLVTVPPHRYYRLFYPEQLANGDALGDRVLLMGADSLTELDTATHTFLTNQRDVSHIKQQVTILYFSGYTMVFPLIPIDLSHTQSGAPEPPTTMYVPVGTTVDALAKRVYPLNPRLLRDENVIRVNRFTQPVFDPNTGDAATAPILLGYQPIQLQDTTEIAFPVHPAGTDGSAWSHQWTLPLVAGDQVRIYTF